jgi:hypothetical protein
MSKLKRARSEKQKSAADEVGFVTRRERATVFAGAKWTFARALFVLVKRFRIFPTVGALST